ncbi:hypothetical protein DXG01_005521, partial [Tephrocybe rancida]
DLELDPEDDDYGSIPLVSDSEGYSVFSVNDCKLYQQAKKTGDFDVSKKKRRTLKDKLLPTLYKSRKFLPKNINFIDLNAPDPIPKASTHTKRPHANDNDEECMPQKRTRSDNDVPGPSKPKNPRTEVAGPSKQFEMTPEMLVAIGQLIKSGRTHLVRNLCMGAPMCKLNYVRARPVLSWARPNV